MILNPAVTATVNGQQPKLAALRDEIAAWIEGARAEAAAMSKRLIDEHEWTARHTQDMSTAQRHVESAWRSLGFALAVVEGK